MALRFAPSPSGHLHVGNLRTALVNWLCARKEGKPFILRLDDTDRERSSEAFADAIDEDLRWLGLDWDQRVRQSDRLARYAKAFETLKAAGRVYPCYETPEELSLRRRALLTAGKPPVYDRAALRLSADERAGLEAAGRQPYWRFQLEPGVVEWDDDIHGTIRIDVGTLSDPVLVRADGAPLYTLSSTVDDINLNITRIIRGDDHVTNTAPQIQLFRALGAGVPAFAHLGLLHGPGGEPLSKSLGSESGRDLRAMGIEAQALASYLATVGTSDPVRLAPMGELTAAFDIGRHNAAPATFDRVVLEGLNAQVVHALSYNDVRAKLYVAGLPNATEAFWLAVRANCMKIRDAVEWWPVVAGAIDPQIEDVAFAAAAAALLPPTPWGDTTWKAWCDAITAKTGRKGKALFQPLRRALTARDHGPEMRALLPLIGPDRTRARLAGTRA